MEFTEFPKLYIDEYYWNKINQVDVNCENAILNTKDKEEIKSLNEIRLNLIDKIKSVRQKVMERFDTLEPRYSKELLCSNTKNIKDEIFQDQYCIVLDIYQCMPLFEFKCGFLIFTQYDDDFLE